MDYKDEIKFNVRIKYRTFILGMTITIILVVIYAFYVPTSESFSFNEKLNSLAQVFGIGTGITMLAYVAANQHLLLKSNYKKEQHEILRYSSEMMRIWSTKEMYEYATISRSVWQSKKVKNEEEFINDILNNEEYYNAIISILNFFEHISLLIDEKIIDERLIKTYYHTVVKINFDRYLPLIKHLRKEDKSSEIHCHFEKMAKRWDQVSFEA